MKRGGRKLVFDLPVACVSQSERESAQPISALLAHGGSPSEINRATCKNGNRQLGNLWDCGFKNSHKMN